jgi:hypothetical protein
LIDPNSVIASEYSLGHTRRRVDLAIFSDEFVGIEFKSKSDTLKRLRPQLDAYVRCFDRVILVADERHIPSAQPLIPASVELWSVDGEGRLALARGSLLRASKSARGLAQLCNIRQLKRLASAGASSTLSRSKLIESAMHLPFDRVYEAAIGAFKDGFARSSVAFWNDLDTREIDCRALASLRRSSDVRQRRKSAIKAQSEFWLAWAEEAASIFESPQHGAAAIN